MNLLVPAYTHPLEDPGAWRSLAGHGPEVTVVVNVHNGPGEAVEEAYRVVTRDLHAAGVPMLGYVDLGYGHRGPDVVRAEVRAWRRYGIEGAFFDQAPASRPHLSAVLDAMEPAPVRVLNFGTRPDPAYARCAATVCTFEGSWRAYLREPEEPDWPNAAHLVYGVPPGLHRVALARLARRVRWGLVTDLAMPLPYAGIPTALRSSDTVPAC